MNRRATCRLSQPLCLAPLCLPFIAAAILLPRRACCPYPVTADLAANDLVLPTMTAPHAACYNNAAIVASLAHSCRLASLRLSRILDVDVYRLPRVRDNNASTSLIIAASHDAAVLDIVDAISQQNMLPVTFSRIYLSAWRVAFNSAAACLLALSRITAP